MNSVLGKRSHYLNIVESEYFHLLLPEMIPFYERWGFKTDINELQLQLMFRYNSLLTAVTNDYSP